VDISLTPWRTRRAGESFIAAGRQTVGKEQPYHRHTPLTTASMQAEILQQRFYQNVDLDGLEK
jgi:hypothetical protein